MLVQFITSTGKDSKTPKGPLAIFLDLCDKVFDIFSRPTDGQRRLWAHLILKVAGPNTQTQNSQSPKIPKARIPKVTKIEIAILIK